MRACHRQGAVVFQRHRGFKRRHAGGIGFHEAAHIGRAHLGHFLHRDVADILVDHQGGIGQQRVEALPHADRDQRVLVAPHDERRHFQLPHRLVRHGRARGGEALEGGRACALHHVELVIAVHHLVGDDGLVDEHPAGRILEDEPRRHQRQRVAHHRHADEGKGKGRVTARHLVLLARNARGTDKDQSVQIIRIGDRVIERDRPAHGIARQREAAHIQRLHHLAGELDHAGHRVILVRHGTRQPVARHVDGNDAVGIAKRCHPGLPGVQGGVGAVHQHQHVAVRPTLIAHMGDGARRQLDELRGVAGIFRHQLLARDIEFHPGRRDHRNGNDHEGEHAQNDPLHHAVPLRGRTGTRCYQELRRSSSSSNASGPGSSGRRGMKSISSWMSSRTAA